MCPWTLSRGKTTLNTSSKLKLTASTVRPLVYCSNRDAVRAYVSEVCPVPMDSSFPFSKQLEDLFGTADRPYVQEIVVGDDPTPVSRQYGDRIEFAQGREDTFREFEEVRIPSLDGPPHAAVGWVAHTAYQGAIPKACGVRGIRARIGNIQIGDETVFDHLFAETRFNRWCVGELHIVDSRIVANARRDYFEVSPHLRNLENHLGPVFRGISARCRSSSVARNRDRKVLSELGRLEEMHDLVESGYLSTEDCASVLRDIELRLPAVSESLGEAVSPGVHHQRIDRLKRKIQTSGGVQKSQAFSPLAPEMAAVIQRVFRAVVAESDSPGMAKRVIERVLAERVNLGS